MSESDYVLEAQVGYLIRRAHQRATAIFEATMREFDVTPVQFAALAKLHDLADQGGPTGQNSVGRAIGVDPATMAGVAARLVKRGFVASVPDPQDARAVRLSLTNEGRTMIAAMKAKAPEVSAATLAPLDAEAARELCALLARLQ